MTEGNQTGYKSAAWYRANFIAFFLFLVTFGVVLFTLHEPPTAAQFCALWAFGIGSYISGVLVEKS